MPELLPLPGLPDSPPTTTTQTTTETAVTSVVESPSWLHTNVRSIILCVVTGTVVYLAIDGVAEARSALVVTFASLASYLFAERAALRVPGTKTE